MSGSVAGTVEGNQGADLFEEFFFGLECCIGLTLHGWNTMLKTLADRVHSYGIILHVGPVLLLLLFQLFLADPAHAVSCQSPDDINNS